MFRAEYMGVLTSRPYTFYASDTFTPGKMSLGTRSRKDLYPGSGEGGLGIGCNTTYLNPRPEVRQSFNNEDS